MADRSLITPELCRQLLRYEPETGKLFWQKGNGQREAFASIRGEGYRHGKILGKWFDAHRMIWVVHYGEWPKGHIDHINGDRGDNRIVNLRDVPPNKENNRNIAIPRDNKSGVMGVCWCKNHKKWHVRIKARGENVYVGAFINFDDAVTARRAAERKYGYHSNHGTRASTQRPRNRRRSPGLACGE